MLTLIHKGFRHYALSWCSRALLWCALGS